MQKKKTTSEDSSTQWQKSFKSAERKNFYKKITIWASIAAVCFFGLAGLVYFADKTTAPTTSVEKSNLPGARSSDIFLGNANANVVITEYADFQCPACAAYNPLINQLLEEYDGKIKVVYRFFPLSQHKNAKVSGHAAYAAWKMGKFKEMKDLLYDNQPKWENMDDPRPTFVEYAKSLKLKTEEFENLMNSQEAKKALEAGEKEALSLGLQSTPSFFIAKKQIQPQGYSDLKALVDSELK